MSRWTLMILPMLISACDLSAPMGALDRDGDGHTATVDCNDDDPSTHPGAEEICDGLDNDCDGERDENASDAILMYVDADNDGFGVTEDNEIACPGSDGLAEQDGDCDDDRADVHPEAEERCDDADVDEDCDGFADDADPEGAEGQAASWADVDEDGYGDPTTETLTCSTADGWVDNGEDCDDSDARQNPEAGCNSDHDGEWSGTFETSMVIAVLGQQDCSESVRFILDASKNPVTTQELGQDCPLGGASLSAVFDGPNSLVFTLNGPVGGTFRAELENGDTFFANETVMMSFSSLDTPVDVFLELEPQ